jgi:hypothetical protein
MGAQRAFCRVGSYANANGSVLAALAATEHPTPATLHYLAHDYGLKEEFVCRQMAAAGSAAESVS